MKEMALFFVVAVHCVLTQSSDEEWGVFKSKYGKVYEDVREETLRREIWTQRRQQIRVHNEAADLGIHSYRMGMNQFGDMAEEELMHSKRRNMWHSRKKSRAQNGRLFTSTTRIEDLPAEVDWRKKGVVSPIANQGMCGSGYAFAAAGSLEGQFALKTGNLTVLSVQNLLDCSRNQGNEGCRGGYTFTCFDYVADNKGIDSRASYPYEGRDGQCRFNRSGVVGTDRGYNVIPYAVETALQKAVAEIGPIATNIDASQNSFRTYTSGVYDDPKCSTVRLDHGMLVVGYGNDKSSGKDYWILKIHMVLTGELRVTYSWPGITVTSAEWRQGPLILSYKLVQSGDTGHLSSTCNWCRAATRANHPFSITDATRRLGSPILSSLTWAIKKREFLPRSSIGVLSLIALCLDYLSSITCCSV